MATSKLNLIWAEKPGCSVVVAEIWIGREFLWLTLLIDDSDGKLKIELLPPGVDAGPFLVDFGEAEQLIETAKRELLAVCHPSK